MALGSLRTDVLNKDLSENRIEPRLTGTSGKTITYNAAPEIHRFELLFFYIADYGTPAQIERALALFNIPFENLFIPATADAPVRDTAFSAKLHLLAAANKQNEIADLLRKQQSVAEFDPALIGAAQSTVISAYLRRRSLDETLSIFNLIYKGKPKSNPSDLVTIPIKRFPTYVSLIIELLYAGRFDDAAEIYQKTKKEFSSWKERETSEDLLAAYARRSQQGTARRYYKNFCNEAFENFQKHETYNIVSARHLARLVDSECLRHDKSIAHKIDLSSIADTPKTNAVRIKNNIIEKATLTQDAHSNVERLAHLKKPLIGNDLENLVFLDPYVAADTCRINGDEKCVGHVADIISRTESFRQATTELKNTSHRFQIQTFDINRKTQTNTSNTTQAKDKNYAQPRFEPVDVAAFKREFGLMPALAAPKPVRPPTPLSRQEIEEGLECAPAKVNDPMGLKYAACLGWHLFQLTDTRDTYLWVQHLMNPYVDWVAKKTP